ncbi:hypothetical protein ACM66B_006986 [Microbotryomycetes sp. NB124-2]
MFKRPYEHKSKAPLRSSDLRKLRDEVQHAFELDSDTAKQAVPDHTLTCRAETHLGEPVQLYFAQNGDPRWFRLGKAATDTLVPTCYTFDVVNKLLPTLVTATAVVENLVKGAALFSQGVSDESLANLPDDMQQGQLVAISAGSSSSIVAVGTLADSKQALLADRKGKAVMTLHARGDFLWASGSGEQPLGADQAADSQAPPTSSKKAGKQKQTKSASNEQTASNDDDNLADKLAATSIESAPAQLDGPAVDRILRNALLLAIAQTLSRDSSLFPMTASTLYSSHVLPNRPAGTPPTADIKKSAAWKKLANFIKAMTKEGLLTSKEVRGELMVTAVNGSHADVQTLRPYKTLAAAAANGSTTDGGATAGSDAVAQNGGSSNKDVDVIVQELYKPSSATLPIFQAIEHDRPELDLYLSHELKKMLSEYYVKENLVHPRDQKYVKPNDVLLGALFKSSESTSDVDVLSKDEAHKRFVNAGQPFWTVQKVGQTKVVKKGSPPVVKVVIKNVGKRQVTLISNHEGWVDVGLLTSEDLSEELKKRSASATSIQPLVGSAKKNQQPKVEIMCQGTHDRLATTLLKEKGVPTKYVEVDLSKSRK